MTTSPDLVALCPFCGASCAKVTTASELNDEDEPYEHSESYAVICDAHMPNGPGGCGASGGFFATEAKAIDAWNRRLAAPLPPQSPASILTQTECDFLSTLVSRSWTYGLTVGEKRNLRTLLDKLETPPDLPTAHACQMLESAPMTDEQYTELARQYTFFNGSHAMTNYPAFARAVLAAQPSASAAPSPEQEDEPLDLISYNKGWDAAIQSMRQVAAHVVEASATGAARDWSKIEKFTDEFIEEYEMRGESEDGRDACYTPNENDRALLRDCIAGLLAEEEFISMLAAPTAPAPQPAQGDGYTPADFACWILDHHPAETTNRESIQRWLAEYDAECAAPAEPQRRGGTSQASGLTDEQIDTLWIMRDSIHNGELMPQLRDFARAVLAATKEPKP